MFSFPSWGCLKITCRWATQFRAKFHLCSVLHYLLHFQKVLQLILTFLIIFSSSVIFWSYFIGLYKVRNLVFIIILVLVNEQWSGIWTWGQMLLSPPPHTHSKMVPGCYLILALNIKGSGLLQEMWIAENSLLKGYGEESS